MALSDTWLRAALGKESPKPFEKTDRDGLSARVSAKGKITFQLRFWHDGKQCRLDIGSYPGTSLKDAREALPKFKNQIEQGHDPRISKQLERRINIDAITVEKLFYQWHESYCIKNKKGHHEIKRSFEIHLLPVFGKFPVEKTTTSMWCDLFDETLKHSESITDRLLVNSKQMLSFAVRRQLIATNPIQNITSKADFNISKKSTNRFLSNDEIRLLFYVLDNSRTALKNALFVKLCLIYGCRNGELRLAKHEDFNFDENIWLVPPENHKTGRGTGKPLKRPILPETKEMFLELFRLSGCKYLLTDSTGTKPMSGMASTALPYNLMQWARKNVNDLSFSHWSIHDLRRTARTNFSTLTQPHVAELMLGHSLGSVFMTYDQYDYIPEMREAYAAWLNRLSLYSSIA